MTAILVLLIGGFLLLFGGLYLLIRIGNSGALSRWGFLPADAVNDLVWKKNFEWERGLGNGDAIWHAETDKDALEEALTLYKAQNSEGAFQIWSAVADRGSIWAMAELGRCYQLGSGVPEDAGKAELWYGRAAESGYLSAISRYVGFLQKRKDYAACEAAYAAAVAQDWPPALLRTAFYRIRQSRRREDFMMALPLLERASEAGSPMARRLLGNWMMRGRFGLRRVPEGLSLRWKAAREAVDIVEATGPLPSDPPSA